MASKQQLFEKALRETRFVSFEYQGIRDEVPLKRLAVPITAFTGVEGGMGIVCLTAEIRRIPHGEPVNTGKVVERHFLAERASKVTVGDVVTREKVSAQAWTWLSHIKVMRSRLGLDAQKEVN